MYAHSANPMLCQDSNVFTPPPPYVINNPQEKNSDLPPNYREIIALPQGEESWAATPPSYDVAMESSSSKRILQEIGSKIKGKSSRRRLPAGPVREHSFPRKRKEIVSADLGVRARWPTAGQHLCVPQNQVTAIDHAFVLSFCCVVPPPHVYAGSRNIWARLHALKKRSLYPTLTVPSLCLCLSHTT